MFFAPKKRWFNAYNIIFIIINHSSFVLKKKKASRGGDLHDVRPEFIYTMHEKKRKFFIVLYGPTAVGKTDLSLTLAQQVSAEIINMDVGQFYTPLSIGTAKPEWRSFSTPHHFFDIINTPRDYTVSEYRTRVFETMESIWQRNKIPLLVGGSGFYLASLFFPPSEATPDTQPLSRAVIQKPELLWQELNQIDPVRAAALHPHDTYRIQRALQIWYTTKQKPSERTTQYQPPASYLIIFLTRDRHELYTRINERVSIMLQHGWVNEVKKLQGSEWETFLRTKGLIGYPELFD
ncbi:MAG: tRNA (adenosine(37)-N6)-dimethylallyltransferase MiaA, partial [Hydrogenophaga sp.]|nr:tRNA (adenosine(37)-N6)-dimethylallyltransferase MiaA [Hydrogenophaga sp.]